MSVFHTTALCILLHFERISATTYIDHITTSTYDPYNFVLNRGDDISSISGTTKVSMQSSDGNWVLYQSGSALWDSKTTREGEYVEIRHSGNIVIKDTNNDTIWESGTNGHESTAPHNLIVDEACVYLLDSINIVLWSKGNCAAPFPTLFTLFPTTNIPSFAPITNPSREPTQTPTISPSYEPSETPSANPTKTPSFMPTLQPTKSPTEALTTFVTVVDIYSSNSTSYFSTTIGSTDDGMDLEKATAKDRVKQINYYMKVALYILAFLGCIIAVVLLVIIFVYFFKKLRTKPHIITSSNVEINKVDEAHAPSEIYSEDKPVSLSVAAKQSQPQLILEDNVNLQVVSRSSINDNNVEQNSQKELPNITFGNQKDDSFSSSSSSPFVNEGGNDRITANTNNPTAKQSISASVTLPRSISRSDNNESSSTFTASEPHETKDL